MEVDLGVTVKYMIHVHWSEIKHTKITNMCSWWTTMIKNKIKSCLYGYGIKFKVGKNKIKL